MRAVRPKIKCTTATQIILHLLAALLPRAGEIKLTELLGNLNRLRDDSLLRLVVAHLGVATGTAVFFI